AELRLSEFAPPEIGVIGKTITVPATVQNLSALTAPASTVRFVLSRDATLGNADDVILGTRSLGPLGAASSSRSTTTLTIPGTAAPGAATLFAIIDAGNTVPEQDERNDVVSAPISLFVDLARTFNVSGVLTTGDCTSPLRNGRAVTLGSFAGTRQTGATFAGTLALTYPLAPALQTSGPVHATVDQAGHLNGAFTYTTKQGSTIVSSGTGTLEGTVHGATLEVTLSGLSASGETCDITGWLAAPTTPVSFMT